MVTINTERLVLREFTREDFEAVHYYGSDPAVVRFMQWGPNTSFETRQFIERSIQSQVVQPRTSYNLAIIKEDQVIGGCGLTIHSISDKRAEIGYCIRREYWRKEVVG